MIDILREERAIAQDRRNRRAKGSYTAYLFSLGLDKILKKCGEECSEVIIAAKNGEKDQLVAEVSDLLYHLAVLLVNEDVSMEDLEAEFLERRAQEGNLKNFHQVDKNS